MMSCVATTFAFRVAWHANGKIAHNCSLPNRLGEMQRKNRTYPQVIAHKINGSVAAAHPADTPGQAAHASTSVGMPIN
jgi:hypothetical protein